MRANDMPGLKMWTKKGKEWKVDLGSLSRVHGSPLGDKLRPSSAVVSPESDRSGSSTYRITLKSFLLAQATEKFLRKPSDAPLSSADPSKPPSKATMAKILKLCRAWHRADARASEDLSMKSVQAYYSGIVCTRNCYEVVTKLNELRASDFGGCNEVKRGKRGKKTTGGEIFISPRGSVGEADKCQEEEEDVSAARTHISQRERLI